MHDRRRRGRRLPEVTAGRARGRRPSSSGGTRSSTCSRPVGPRSRATSTPSADFSAAKNEDVVLGSQATPRWTAPHFVWAVRDELADKVCGVGTPTCKALENGGLRVTTTLDTNIQKIAEKWVQRSGHRAARQGPHRGRQGPRLQEARAVDGEPAHQGPAQRRPRRLRLPDRRAHRLRRQRELLRDLDEARFPAAVRRRGQGLPPARFGVQAVQLRHRHRRPQDHRRHDADGRRDRLRELHAERRRQPRARTGAGPERAPVLAQHPVGQDDGDQRPRPRVRQGQGLRDELPGCPQGAARAGAGCPGGPPGRPRHGLRHDGQRRQGRSATRRS